MAHPRQEDIFRHGSTLLGTRRSKQRPIHFWPTALLRWPLQMALVISDPVTGEFVRPTEDGPPYWDLIPESRGASPLYPDDDQPYTFLLDQNLLYNRVGEDIAAVSISLYRYDPDVEDLLVCEQTGMLIVAPNETILFS